MTRQLELIPAFEAFIAESIQGKRRLHSGRKISMGTINQYQVVLLYLREFEIKFSITLRCTIGANSTQRKYTVERNYWCRFRRKLELFLQQEHNCYDAYIASVFKTIRAFLNYLRGEKGLGLPVFNKVFNFPTYTYQHVILDNVQLRLLANNQLLQQQLAPNLKRSLDMFLVGCIIGLRFSDLLKLKTGNIRKFDAHYFVEMTTQKTGTTVIIPLPKFASDIILHQRKQKSQFVFRSISMTNFNLHLKEIMMLAGFTASAPKYRHRKGKLIEIRTRTGEHYRVCDHFSSHCMRRIAITSLLTMGVPEQVVRKLSGHAAGSKEFYRYVTLAQDYSNREIAQAQEKLFGEFNRPEAF